MKTDLKEATTKLFLCCLAAIIVSSCSTKNRIETIAFATDHSSVSDSEKTVKNFKQQDELFVLTQFGAYDDKTEWLNNYLLTEVSRDSTNALKKKNMCSIFFTTNQSGVTYHCQNFDNPASGIIVASFNAPGKYKSIAVIRMTDITYFPSSFDINAMTDMQKSFLPFFALYPVDGMNEYGLTVSTAGSYAHKVTETKNRKGVYTTYLNRLMLDSCKSVDEAVALAGRYYFFDHGGMVAANHLLIADKFGNSAIIEYNNEGKMQFSVKKSDNLVMTNVDVVGVDSSDVKCVRYKAICKQLKEKPVVDYKDCMNILKTVENKTLWSVVMDSKTNTGYIAVGGKFDHFYKFSFN